MPDAPADDDDLHRLATAVADDLAKPRLPPAPPPSLTMPWTTAASLLWLVWTIESLRGFQHDQSGTYCLIAAVFWLVRLTLNRRRPPVRIELNDFRIAGILIWIAVISCSGFGSCPHSAWFYVGPLGIDHSAVGGPCANLNPARGAVHVAGNWWIF